MAINNPDGSFGSGGSGQPRPTNTTPGGGGTQFGSPKGPPRPHNTTPGGGGTRFPSAPPAPPKVPAMPSVNSPDSSRGKNRKPPQKNLTNFDNTRQSKGLINDLNMRRLGPAMANPMRIPGRAQDSNRPSQLPSHQGSQTNGSDDGAIAKVHLKNASDAADMAQGRAHAFRAINSFNRALRKAGGLPAPRADSGQLE